MVRNYWQSDTQRTTIKGMRHVLLCQGTEVIIKKTINESFSPLQGETT